MKIFFAILFVFCASLTSTYADSSKDFLRRFNETVQLNKSRFKNVNLVYPGDTVMVVKNGIVPVIIKSKNLMAGKHDCIWYAVERTGDINTPTTIVKTDKLETGWLNQLLEDLRKNADIVTMSLLFLIFLTLLVLLIVVSLRRQVIVNNNFNCNSGRQAQSAAPPTND
jgi:hypothetical protein